MMNFLTATDASPKFAGAIDRLMRRSLVPAGTILVLGGVGAQYRNIYPELDQRASAARLICECCVVSTIRCKPGSEKTSARWCALLGALQRMKGRERPHYC
jgi:hypothetical protein